MKWYLQPLKKYAVFKGRARRKEYWGFALFNFITAFVLSFIEVMAGSDQGLLPTLYVWAILLPSLAVGVRRLHDTGRSGWWLFLNFVPLIGSIVIFIFLLQDSEPGENQYGPNPKRAAAIEEASLTSAGHLG